MLLFRTSFLTGRRPETTRVYDQWHHWRDVSGNPDLMSLPERFKSSGGYRTFSIGKVFHDNGDMGDPQSWTEDTFEGEDYYK